MAFDLWLTFATSAALISVILGPSVLIVTGQALAGGRMAALRSVAGDVAGRVTGGVTGGIVVVNLILVVIVGGILSGHALMAARAQAVLQGERARHRIGYAGGGALIGSGILAAITR